VIIAGFFQQHNDLRNEMKNEFKKKGYSLKEKRFILGQVLGYAPYFSDMTISEMKEVIDYLKKTNKDEAYNLRRNICL
jgi:hypothetical protein